MTQYDLVALGGTFDLIHKGHMELLNKAFSISAKVIIGLTSDSFALKKGKQVQNDYSSRYDVLESLLKSNFTKSSFEISKLENDFGPAVLEKNVQALVVSEEKKDQGTSLNELRGKKGISAVDVIVVPMVLAEDGSRISTTRIKHSEIDSDGKLS